jgi:hypothetical protein
MKTDIRKTTDTQSIKYGISISQCGRLVTGKVKTKQNKSKITGLNPPQQVVTPY